MLLLQNVVVLLLLPSVVVVVVAAKCCFVAVAKCCCFVAVAAAVVLLVTASDVAVAAVAVILAFVAVDAVTVAVVIDRAVVDVAVVIRHFIVFYVALFVRFWTLLSNRLCYVRDSPLLTFTWWGRYGLCQRHLNQPTFPTPFSPVLVSISVFVALFIVFHSINSPAPDNTPVFFTLFFRSYLCLLGPFNYIHVSL